ASRAAAVARRRVVRLVAASDSLGSPLVVALLAVLALVELGLLAWALVDLARRPADRVTGGSRLLWLLLCLFVQLIGPALYLVVGRVRATPRPAPVPQAPGGDGHVARAAAALYDAAGARPLAGDDGAPLGPPGSARRSGAAVELASLSKVFRTAAALDGLSLRVPEGSVFGFLGPNGAGKTTTLRILAGLARPTSGTAHVLGHDVAAAGGEVRALVGFLPDVPAFYKWMTAPQYLRFAGSLFGLRGAVLEARVAALLDLAGLAGVETRIGGFSRGMKQRLGVAQALVNAPRLLLLDEPTSALDPIGRREVLDMIAALRGRTTVFFSTHILADVERVCDTVAIIDNGRVAAHAPIDELRRRRGGLSRLVVEVDEPQRLAAALESASWLRALDSAEGGGVRLATDDLEAAQRELPALVARLGLALLRLESDELSLEDVFVDLVEGERR
ncbi:MAG: ABC transporter ATP-binding protein, partial [Actinobacteria bacterium]|nr:ABC transporter ATP-binding protein [Actinomycetota bacterium]